MRRAGIGAGVVAALCLAGAPSAQAHKHHIARGVAIGAAGAAAMHHHDKKKMQQQQQQQAPQQQPAPSH